MSQKHEESSTYAMGYSDEFMQILHRRNAETRAAHLMSYLCPGSRVLDVGCAPSSISVGLAYAIEPGGMLASREVVTYASFVGTDESVVDVGWSIFV